VNFGFAILDFVWKKAAIRNILRIDALSVNNPRSQNCGEPGRRTQTLKWVGLCIIPFVLVAAEAAAQQQSRVHRIGLLTTGFVASTAHVVHAFKQSLRELGYVEGQNVLLEMRFGEAKTEQLPNLAADLVRLKVAVIVAFSNPAIEAARQATQTIPIVMPIGSDPVGVGFVSSLARPGGNITGLSSYSPELNGKRLELLKETVPKLSRIALLMSPNIPGNANDQKETDLAARSLRLRSQLFEVKSPSDLGNIFQQMSDERVQAFVVFPGQPTLFAGRKQLVEIAEKNRLPAMYPLVDYVDAGGLISYGINNVDLFRRAATYVDKILKGAKPGDLPVEQPTKFELVINLKGAKQIGLTIPPNVLARADRVIK
jgi:putative ABC transport system substrate-binding protein